jgi:fructose 1,6-bisphosphate aldolase/phosphatase
LITISAIKADVGGYVGHSAMHPDVLEKGREEVEKARQQGLLIDHHVTYCGDDLFLIMTHEHGENYEPVHRLAWNVFIACTDVAKKLANRWQPLD